MKIKKLLQYLLGGALGVVGMVVSLVRGGQGEKAPGAARDKGKSPGREELSLPKGEAEEGESTEPAAKKKRVRKPVAARKATPAAKQGGAAPPAKRAPRSGAASAKGAKKAATAKAAKG